MNRRDQELLDKQLRRLAPAPWHDSVMALAIAAVFFAGLALGVFFSSESPPMRVAAGDSAAAISLANAARPITSR